ncbi:MAG: molybdopterin-binding protein [Paracoccaceae bacterium]
MKFGAVPVGEAEGAILAHSLAVADGRVRKGVVLTGADIGKLVGAGFGKVTVARLEEGDVGEDLAAERIAQAMVPDPAAAHLRLNIAANGRVNIYAVGPGILRLDVAAIEAANLVDPMITIATLPVFARVYERRMVATVKTISYGVAQDVMEEVARRVAGAASVLPVVLRTATLIQTEIGSGDPVKGEAATASRLEALGMDLIESLTVRHETLALAAAIAVARGDIVLILTASATSDPVDVAPQAVREAGGKVTRFGLPVDPGNLLFLGEVGDRPVIGLPGCARSPALNGADWVLERVVCGVVPSNADMAAMGVGGLLKESKARGMPREGR